MAGELKAVVYTRVSTEEQAAGGTSLGDQQERGLRACELRGALPVKVCEDAGVSGARYTTRPGLMEALHLIESGAANLLIVTKIDRLARKASIILEVAGRVDRAGGQIVTCDGMEFGKTPVGRLMLTLLAAMAEFERDNIRERSMAGKVRRALDGVQPSRAKSPYGYHVVTRSDVEQAKYPGAKPGDYHVIEAEARWVRQMFQWYDEGNSLRGIARLLNERLVPTKCGASQWGPQTVRSILMNPAFKGTAGYGRQESVTGENLTWLRYPDRPLQSHRRTLNKKSPTVEIAVPALVDADLWQRCRNLLDGNAAEKQAQFGGNPMRRYMLSGLTRCPSCCHRMSAENRPLKSGEPKTFYTCRANRACQNRKRGQQRWYNGDSLHAATIAAVMHVAQSPEMVTEALRAYEEHTRERLAACPTTQDKERVTADLARINAEIEATRRAMVEAMKVGLREGDFLGDLSRLAKDRERAEARLQSLSVAAGPEQAAQDPVTTAGKLAHVAAAVAKVFDADDKDFTTAEKQALLYKIVDSVTPIDDGAEVIFKPLTVNGVTVSCTVKTGPNAKSSTIIVSAGDGWQQIAAA